MSKYHPQKIERKWQNAWYGAPAFTPRNSSIKKKCYLLVEFPYPSGDGLHVGHCRSYIAMDIIARARRMQGCNVLYPMGWDAFGLPTENYAIKTGLHPAAVTKKNTDRFRKQMKSLGLSFEWSREINTTDPKYYKWTQWIFTKLFEKGLAYKSAMLINWCLSCKVGLANEEVVDGKCERCGTKVEKREKEQWLIKITKYAERLIDGLERVNYPERVKIQQREWIGRSEGVLVKFPLEGAEDSVEVFTTRIDTIFSGTFLIVAPGHPLIDRHRDHIENISEFIGYHNRTKQASDIERTREGRELSGVELRGITVHNPATGEKMPVWAADFVLEHYGTGAVFADAHDRRDFEFAKKYGIPLRTSVAPPDPELAHRVKNLEECYEGEGMLYNSMQFDGMASAEARPKITAWLKEKGLAEKKVSYKLRDWIFSRQHYWGEPIPMIYCASCKWQTVPERDLPVTLPNVKKYQPADTGESPLAGIAKWVSVKCPKCRLFAKRETDTMPNWAGSNWYYLRYADPKNNSKLADGKKLKYWLPVDWYNGGMEHTTLHLLYSRFIFKFLWDISAVPREIGDEPYAKRTSHGMILGPGGVKMSKSRGNVVNPDEVTAKYGADTLRVYEMFMGPFEQMIPWDEKGIIGAWRFLKKVHQLVHAKKFAKSTDAPLKALLHKTIKKVSEDIEAMKFNTAVSALMEFANLWQAAAGGIDKKDLQKFLIILFPFAPHLAEELWKSARIKGFCSMQKWPEYDKWLTTGDKALIVVQVNGKVRDTMEVDAGTVQEDAQAAALERAKVQQWITGKAIKKIVFVPDKLINIVI